MYLITMMKIPFCTLFYIVNTLVHDLSVLIEKTSWLNERTYRIIPNKRPLSFYHLPITKNLKKTGFQ